jgi:hypothetical protein
MKGIRAAVCHDVHSAHQSVEHDDVNIMCIGTQIVGALAGQGSHHGISGSRISTDEDFRRRVAKLHAMDAGNWLSPNPRRRASLCHRRNSRAWTYASGQLQAIQPHSCGSAVSVEAFARTLADSRRGDFFDPLPIEPLMSADLHI